MIVDYISDIHENFYFKHNKKLSQKEVKVFFDALLPSDKPIGEVLIIAGDIGEYNKRIIDLLIYIQKIYDYKRIFFTLGNNEFHLKTLKHAINYHYSSDKKIHELIDMAKELEKDGIYLLNGDVVEYKGIKFGGAMGWYDGSYAKKLDSSFDDKFIQKRWEETNNDYKFILNLKTYRVMFLTEIIKLYKIIDQVDVMISHINPISEPIAFPSKYKESEDNAYFCFDGGKIIEKTTAKYWIYGHNHESWNYNLFNTKFLSNPLGYPMESMLRDNTLKSFLINSKK